MAEWSNAHDSKSCVLPEEHQGFKSLSLRQERQRLNKTEKVLQYIFINGVAGVVAERQYKPRSYANNHNVHGADGKFVRS